LRCCFQGRGVDDIQGLYLEFLIPVTDTVQMEIEILEEFFRPLGIRAGPISENVGQFLLKGKQEPVLFTTGKYVQVIP